ncbi:MAG: hypothetical protein H6605_02220 [Flavobacteriales bacterium]|nr:hypothetical protein [Flavobacteriales bacterium]
MFKNKYITFLITLVVLVSCTGQRKFQKGDYHKAFLRASNKLKNKPNNQKAANTLSQAYNLLVKNKMEEVYALQKSNDVYKWEKIVNNYQQLNKYYDEIRHCPACMKIIPDPNQYTSVLTDAMNNAAEVRYNEGLELMKQKTMESAQEAYRNFKKARYYSANYKDIDRQMSLAREAGTYRVVLEHIPMHSRTMKISSEFFENSILEFLHDLNYDFVEFYSPEESRSLASKPHHFIELNFDDFIIGQTYIHEKDQDITRDSVIVGTVTNKDKTKQNVYGTVSAKLHTFTKTVSSTGLLDLKIVDEMNSRILAQDKLPGTYVWETRWGWYTGDNRALTDEQIEWTRSREAFPPPPQQLFIEFTKPIYNQAIQSITRYYSRYRS